MNRRDYLETIGALGAAPALNNLDFEEVSETEGTWGGTIQWVVDEKTIGDDLTIDGDVDEIKAVRLLEDGPVEVTLTHDDKVEFYGDAGDWEYVGLVYLEAYNDKMYSTDDLIRLMRPIVTKGWPVEEWASIKMEPSDG